MAYNELIKNFERIRGYMREFYVYGFRSREEFNNKSIRSYDNERRRLESWLGKYMEFRHDSKGKASFITMDSRDIPHNPLYKAFKAKSFTDNDITLHFYILDLLAEGESLTVKEITEAISEKYLSHFAQTEEVDESTIRKKLKEYEQLGMLKSSKVGRELAFSRVTDNIDLNTWQAAIEFYSESDPMGVVGSYLLDSFNEPMDFFRFKHHYLLHALNSEVISELLQAIKEKRCVEITTFVARRGELRNHTVFPAKIYVGTQSGRQYLLGYHYRLKRPMFLRLDSIRKVKPGAAEKQARKYLDYCDKLKENLWGVSLGTDYSLDHIEITIHIGKGENYILQRLQREKRCGTIVKIDDNTYKFIADVYDAAEMMTWIRSFIGRIVKLECSNKFVEQRFYGDLKAMRELYGGTSDAVQ